MRRALFGLLAGALLSAARSPWSNDPFDLPVAPAELTYGARALGLAAVALAVLVSRGIFSGRGSNALALAAAGLGFLIHGLVAPKAGLAGPRASVPLVLLLGLFLVARGKRAKSAAAPAVEPRGGGAAEVVALLLGGVGAALALEGVARHIRLFGAGLVADDTVFAVVFFALALVGAIAFGRALRTLANDLAHGTAAVIALPLSAAAGYVSLFALQSATSQRGLDRLVRTFQLDISRQGMLDFDALLAATGFVLPAFALGTALYCARRQRSLAMLLLGAAIGTALVPDRLALPVGGGADQASFAARLVMEGSVVAALGCAVGALSRGPRKRAARAGQTVVAVLVGVLAVALPVAPVPVLSPWAKRLVVPSLTLEIPEGLLTVEPSPGGLAMATLDRRALSPPTEGAAADGDRIELAFRTVSDEARARGARVLLLGQLTPGRALVLEALGAVRVDRSAAWHEAMEALETQLFARVTVQRSPGDVLAPEEARRRWLAGEYDLVLVPPVPGEVPALPEVPETSGTPLVVWLDAGQHYAAARALPEAILLSAVRFADLSLGVVLGRELDPEPSPGAPAVVHSGSPVAEPWPLDWLRTRRFHRVERALAAVAERLRRANAGTPWYDLTEGLALHYAVQHHSSPFDSPEESVELDEIAMDHFLAAALVREPDAFTRRLWDALARILVGKRMIDVIESHVRPLAEAWPGWETLERALAYAELEQLRPEAALERLDPLYAEHPDDPVLQELMTQALSQAGQHERAIELLRRQLRDRPEHPQLRRRLGIELLRAGDPDGEGRTLLEDLLLENPDDLTLREMLAPGAEPQQAGFEPLGPLDAHEH